MSQAKKDWKLIAFATLVLTACLVLTYVRYF